MAPVPLPRIRPCCARDLEFIGIETNLIAYHKEGYNAVLGHAVIGQYYPPQNLPIGDRLPIDHLTRTGLLNHNLFNINTLRPFWRVFFDVAQGVHCLSTCDEAAQGWGEPRGESQRPWGDSPWGATPGRGRAFFRALGPNVFRRLLSTTAYQAIPRAHTDYRQLPRPACPGWTSRSRPYFCLLCLSQPFDYASLH